MSRVIRGDGARPGSKVVAHEVVDARERAKELVDQAQAEAERLVAQAQREADALRETARREGAETGRAEAAAVLARAHERRAALLAEAELALASLGAEAARKVVRAELALAPERVRDIAADLLGRVRRARELTLKVAAADADRVRAILPTGATLDVSPDLAPGDVVVTTESGELDARIDVQLDALERALAGR